VENSYKKLFIAVGINAIIMFFLTYVMIANTSHFLVNINKIYMALIMAAPMVIVMLLVMRSMFMNKRLNAILIASFAAITLVLFFLIRVQVPVGNIEFLRSMIPHHSSAILMCEQATITDPEIKQLCDQIVQSQQEEIHQMEAILQRMK
jgi:hypothetical protein